MRATKIDHPKRMPKRYQGHSAKYHFLLYILMTWVFCGRSRRSILFRIVAKLIKRYIGFIVVSDALIEAMLDHPRARPK